MKSLLLGVILLSVYSFVGAQKHIADYTVAKESVLRSIPEDYINLARNQFKIAFQHTSHGTQVSRGMYGLQDYKAGDRTLFGITNDDPQPNKLEFHDYAIGPYHAEGEEAVDLSRNETAFIQATRNYLALPKSQEVNVVMWAWCEIEGHDVINNYIPGMQTLINEYGEGGTKIGTGEGMRRTPVHFIFMTGRPKGGSANLGAGNPEQQAQLIKDYCGKHGYFCLDYYTIDTYDLNDNYWNDTDEDGFSAAYGGNFLKDFQDAQVVGDGYYENKKSPDGSIVYGEHNSQHITANRKAFAFWWILARLAGYKGVSANVSDQSESCDLYFNENSNELEIGDFSDSSKVTCNVYSSSGVLVCSENVEANSKISLSVLSKGMYVVQLKSTNASYVQKIIVAN